MATAENAKLEYEGGQTIYPMSALTDSGDHQTYTSAADRWSGRSGYAAVVMPDGVKTGGMITPHNDNDKVQVAALTCNVGGQARSVSAGAVEITRPATDVARIISIVVKADGSLDEVPGTSASDTTFVETRGAAGGPPLIPVGEIEIGQVRVTTSAAGKVSASEIYQVPNVHVERADFPLFAAVPEDGGVKFNTPVPAIHTGNATKGVYASFAEPVFTEVALASDFVPPETSHSVSSTQVYSATIGSSSSTLNQGTFTAYLENGVSDPLVALKNEELWFRFYPDRYQPEHILTQGKLGIARTFPAGDQIQAACTISAKQAAKEVA
ncbi:MAG: hypothetical protein RBR77_04165 [Thauera sp.]|jgi:hypothetical protein|nr:hypothetical protein [Thauera sp.]